MPPLFRKILGVLAGLLVGGTLLMVVEYAGHQVYPPPEGMDPTDIESIRAHMADVAAGALLFILLAWAAGSFAGSWLATLVTRGSSPLPGLTVGSILMLLGILNMLAIPHPVWFRLAGLLVFLPPAWAGTRLGART